MFVSRSRSLSLSFHNTGSRPTDVLVEQQSSVSTCKLVPFSHLLLFSIYNVNVTWQRLLTETLISAMPCKRCVCGSSLTQVSRKCACRISLNSNSIFSFVCSIMVLAFATCCFWPLNLFMCFPKFDCDQQWNFENDSAKSVCESS